MKTIFSPNNIFLLLIFISTSQCFYFIPILHFNYGNTGIFGNEGRSYINQGGPLYEKIYPKSLSSDLDPRFIHKKLASFQIGLRSFFHEEDLNATCVKMGGVLLEGECYDYIPSLQTFDDAQFFCSENRGHIWTPNFDDIFLFNKIRIVLPDFTAAPKNGIWIGAKTMNGVILDVNGNDETGSQFFQIDNQDPNANEGCAVYDFQTGAQTFTISPCDETYHFICEYDAHGVLKDEEEIRTQTLLVNKKPFFFFK
ncbi:UNVERIFIED_CONTAM: hypothetical protein RMT77_013604 [Armadillidium vulgare]